MVLIGLFSWYGDCIRTHRTFTVVARVPEALEALKTIAHNLGWLFDRRVQELFEEIDTDASRRGGLDPLGILNRCPTSRLAELAADHRFVERSERLLATLQAELDSGPQELPTVAYFSPEFGIAASVPQYSGGLGVLAGDHLKAASDMHIPIIGVGLFYRSGYFRQVLDEHLRQQERFPWLHPSELALERVDHLSVDVPLDNGAIPVNIWRASIGANSLFLLDTYVHGESSPDQLVTDRLYGGGSEQRIRQEILLGVGGARALDRLGLSPSVFHLNEGHAGFLTLERIRVAMHQHGLDFEAAVELVRPSMVFTTHTPVPAGIDRFSHDLVRHYFQWWCDDTAVPMERLLALGGEPEGDPNVFNLAHMSLRLCGRSNGVAELHGDVSRRMFSSLWPEVPTGEIPIGHVTNGVHADTFMDESIASLLDEHVGINWKTASAEQFRAVHACPDEDLWRVRNDARARLVNWIRWRQGNGNPILDPAVLTIGFARRFATYKRADLILNNIERLDALFRSDRPIQLVVAGKAHPADEPGKEILHRIAELAHDPQYAHRIAFVEDYDLDAGRMLTRGVDVWLNNPLRPMEACGTSGMKAALNGVLNLSVLDGWWAEAYDPRHGWAIRTADHLTDPGQRDTEEANALYDLLEEEVIPQFYDRDRRGIPTAWTTRMAVALEQLVPRFHAGRMVRQYVETMYLPAAARAEFMAVPGRAADLAGWKHRVETCWPRVRITEILPPTEPHSLEELTLTVGVDPGELTPEEYAVQYAIGPLNAHSELGARSFQEMERLGYSKELGAEQFRARFTVESPGVMGCAVRVVPSNLLLESWTDLGCIRWGD